MGHDRAASLTVLSRLLLPIGHPHTLNGLNAVTEIAATKEYEHDTAHLTDHPHQQRIGCHCLTERLLGRCDRVVSTVRTPDAFADLREKYREVLDVEVLDVCDTLAPTLPEKRLRTVTHHAPRCLARMTSHIRLMIEQTVDRPRPATFLDTRCDGGTSCRWPATEDAARSINRA